MMHAIDKSTLDPYIKICCPCYDLQAWQESIACACVESMKKESLSFTFEAAVGCSSIIEEGRNALISSDKTNQMIHQTLNKKFTHWLFIDHDVGFTSGQIKQLVGRNVDIVSGAYRPKDKPEQFVAGYCSDIGRVSDYIPAIPQGLIEIDWCGAGCLLCTRHALEKMEYPWFWKTVHKYGNRMMTQGEDVYFCMNARNQLLTVYLDTDCILNHEANRTTVKIYKV